MAQARDADLQRRDWLATEFERHRAHLRAVGYRMLGSVTESEDAVQEAWIRLDRRDPGGTDDLRGWLTVTVCRICLDLLRSRRAKRETYAGTWLPAPLVTQPETGGDHARPEHEALLADSVGIALLVVFETLSPPERLCFVLHDVFGVPFDRIGPIVDRTPAAARQLASRARRRVQAEAPDPDADVAVQRQPPGSATSRGCFGCSIRTSCSGPMAAASEPSRGRPSAVPPGSPTRHGYSDRASPRTRARHSSTARQASSSRVHPVSPGSSPPSRSAAAGSSPST